MTKRRELPGTSSFEIRSSVERRRAAWSPRLPLSPRLILEVVFRSVGALVFLASFIGSITLPVKLGVSGLALEFAPLSTLLVLLLVAHWSRRASVVVGSDGIDLRRLGGRRFVPYDRLTRLVREGDRLVLEERGRAPLRLRVRRDGRARTKGESMMHDLDDLVRSVGEAHRAYGKAAALAPLDLLVASARNGDPGWLARARTSTSREAYRESPLTAEALWPLVEDGARAPAERVAAAVALRATLDDEGQARLRIAATATLAPRVRVALEAALDEDDEQLQRSFTALVADEAHATQRRP